MSVTYAEARAWAVWLDEFTVTDLADSMAVPPEIVDGFVLGLIFNGTIQDTGLSRNGRGDPETVYRYIRQVLPADPRNRPRYPPEWFPGRMGGTPGVGSEAPRRGVPIRLRGRSYMNRMSMPGERKRLRERERRAKEMQRAQNARERQRRQRNF